MLVVGANPALTFPNSRKVQEALSRLEFLAVMDIFPTETARYAHVVLPAATFLEKTELCDLRNGGSLTRLSLVPPAIFPQGEARPEWRFWFELAGRLGLGSHFPWSSIEEAIEEHSPFLGIPFSELKGSPQGIEWGAQSFRRYESEGFATPSGRVEIYSDRLRRLGYDPLPTGDLAESRAETLLSIGAKPREFVHSQFRNISSLRQQRPQPVAEMSPMTARGLKLGDGDTVTISTHKGEIEMLSRIDHGVVPGAVFVPHGWAEANANVLTDDADLDPISGFPEFRAVACSASRLTKHIELPCVVASQEAAA
jgi:anaerobic selenocysteine-containing dehydrogenase